MNHDLNNLHAAQNEVSASSAGGAHFLPYAWLHRTRLYLALAVAVSLGAFALQLVLRSAAFPYILIYMAIVYWVLAPLVYRHAARVVNEPAPA